MFGLQILDVAIGLIFIFLLLSLTVTAASELIASWLKRRSATLWRGIVRLLGDESIAKDLYTHPLIAALSDRGMFKKPPKLPSRNRPSYIPSGTFALALVDMLAPGQRNIQGALESRLARNPDDHLARSLNVLLQDVQGNTEAFKKRIEQWFDDSMDRVSGWYKRRTQWILVLLAVILTVATNADTIAMAGTLWRNPGVRSALVAQAQVFAQEEGREIQQAAVAQPKTGPSEPPDRLPYESAAAEEAAASENFQQSMARLQSLALPLGWSDAGAEDGDPRESAPQGWSEWRAAVGRHFLGWLLTALAISLGAPFWFDMLNKVIAVRATGKPPAEKAK